MEVALQICPACKMGYLKVIGILGAFVGGIHGGRRLVGEHGPELLDLAPGTRVHSNPDTERILRREGTGGPGPTIILNVHGSVISERDLAERIKELVYAGDYGTGLGG